VLFELEGAPENVKGVLSNLSDENIDYVSLNEESIQLANSYLTDILVSWNFKHIEVQERCFMKAKKFDAVEMKRQLQKEVENKFSPLSKDEQLELLRKKFGHLIKKKMKAHVA